MALIHIHFLRNKSYGFMDMKHHVYLLGWRKSSVTGEFSNHSPTMEVGVVANSGFRQGLEASCDSDISVGLEACAVVTDDNTQGLRESCDK